MKMATRRFQTESGWGPGAYTQWCNDDACAAAVLTASVLPQFASEFMGLGTAPAMWTYLCQRYQPSGDGRTFNEACYIILSAVPSGP